MPIMPTRPNRVPRLGQPAQTPLGSIELPSTYKTPAATAPNNRPKNPLQEHLFSNDFPRTPDGVAALRQLHNHALASGDHEAGVMSAIQLQNRGVDMSGYNPNQQGSPVPPLGQPAPHYGGANGGMAAQPPVNRYNTPNMNTYVTPDNRIAAGYGNDLGIDRLLQQHRQQQAQNGYSQWDRDRLRLGGAPPMDTAAPQPPGAMAVLGREVAPYGSVPASGQRSVSMGPIDDRAANIARRQKLATDQLMARRAALMTGRPLREQFRTQSVNAPSQMAAQQVMYPDTPAASFRQTPPMNFTDQQGLPISPFDMPGRVPFTQRREPTSMFGALQRMMYGQ